MGKIKGLAHICLGVRSLDKSLWFYCNVLELEKFFEFENKDSRRIGAYLKMPNGTFIEIFEVDNNTQQLGSSVQHLCFETGNIKASAERLKKFDVDVTEIKMGEDNSWQCWFKDPDGTKIEFHEYTEQSSQKTGAKVIVELNKEMP